MSRRAVSVARGETVYGSMATALRVLVLWIVTLLGAAGCRRDSGAPPPQPVITPWFADVTGECGIDFLHRTNASGNYFMPESVGSGAAVLDYDNDGRLDVYLVQNGGPHSDARNQLFHQQPDGRFINVSAGSGLDVTGHGMGAAIGDVNNDGWPDILVTEYTSVRLFINMQGRSFREITAEAGLDNPLWAISASFLDYDRDGWLDLVVANYLTYDPGRQCADETGQPEYCGPKTFPPGAVTKLFRNRARGWTDGPMFEDVTISSGLGSSPGPALGVVGADFDGDGWCDIFVSNDGEANHLWMNRRDGTFANEATLRGVAFNGMGAAQGDMGIALGDVDEDGMFDLFVTHLIEETHALWTQGPRGLFQDRTGSSGLARPEWHGTGFGTAAQDLDNSGTLDIAIVNGGVRRNKLIKPDANTVAAVGAFWAPYAERNQLFTNQGRGKFCDISAENEPFCGTARVGRGLVYADLDNDGGLDLIVTSIDTHARIFRNVASRGHWLLVRAVDPKAGNRDAYGARITVRAGDRQHTRWCNPASSYASSNDPRAHFGLGTATRVEEIEILWPDGNEERFPGAAADQLLTLRKGDGTARSP